MMSIGVIFIQLIEEKRVKV